MFEDGPDVVHAAKEGWDAVADTGKAIGGPVVGLAKGRVPWHVAQTTTALTILLLWPLASGVVAIVEGDGVLGVALLLLAAWPSSYLVPFLRGRVRPGGLYLTPQDLTYLKHGGSCRIAWEDVVAADPVPPSGGANERVAVQLASWAKPALEWTSRWGRRGRVAPTKSGVLRVEARFLTMDQVALSDLLNRCRQDDEVRAILGTAESLAWANRPTGP